LSAEISREQPLVLLDGMSLAFRAFFALSPDIATSGGLQTNALHGFASMLLSLVKSQRPRALAVAFDLPGGTFRDEMTEDYKGGRAATPPEIEHQFDLIEGLCGALNIPVVGVERFEADDVLATLSAMGRDEGWPVVVVTGDRDSFQLVEDPLVRVLYNKRGVSDYDLYDEAGIVERCGIEPARYPMFAALRGDSSDNLPGVPGVGEKTAAKLFATYRDLDDLYQHLDDLTPKLRENLAEYENRARQNERVMRLVRDVPLSVNLDELVLGGWRNEEVAAFFDRYEMQAMRRRYETVLREGLFGSSVDSVPAPTLVATAPSAPTLVAAPLADLGDGEWFLVAANGEIAVVEVASSRWAIAAESEVLAHLGARPLSGHGVKEVYRRALESSYELGPVVDDLELAGFLLDSTSGRYEVDDLALRYLGEVSQPPTLFSGGESLLAGLLDRAWRLRTVLSDLLAQWELGRVYREVELPLVRVLARMEVLGIAVDREMLSRIAREFSEEARQLEGAIQEFAGHDFRVNSPQQLQVVLYDELGLARGKKTKTGYSTDAGTLESLRDQHPIVDALLRYREVEKLRSTYGTPLIDAIGSDGRIHAQFHQTVARTGRLSSENPNLHNIPVRTAEGRRLRYAFVPHPGWEFCVADYNQIELRILAHLAQDEGLLGAFASGVDVHRAIASRVFHVPDTEVTHEQRERAKAVSYGLAYGMEAFGLSQRLRIPVNEAREIIDQYFEGFPRLRAYVDQTLSEIRVSGVSRTEFGRIRPFPDLLTASGPARAAAERQAVNAGIQGLAADIFKSALVRLDQGLAEAALAARLVLQVHDEVIVEAPSKERSVVEEVVREALIGAVSLRVPLEISLGWGPSWAEAKG
jgi:DNA polymerase-1